MEAQKLVETYAKAWNTSDAEMRLELLSACWDASGRYADPGCELQGRQALSDQIGRFHRDDPGARLSLTSAADGHNGYVRFQWNLNDSAGNKRAEGTSFGRIGKTGLLHEVVGFFGPFPKAASGQDHKG
ncbi:nuclear transport factor 2 family protein [Phaeobacter gallaeciensis]|nr:nuclear transport factor 2 family protein [Phaeobacter gallaeciensis]AHD08863.1 hypothetical protein Gal_01090 [Phaeobacter gallaeciensis DSM 26640]ATE92129.1 hypothetical protein PhaeoP11_01085 [Phaeobacter gallaeciensis]ATE98052.1 hypothetical protein PhaeoP73_02764 [Phaeobacter gallaeciensis]ATF00740.1 hypothetical protein PhaeoP75_01081 [Phaeobacter gallaeciensis]